MPGPTSPLRCRSSAILWLAMALVAAALLSLSGAAAAAPRLPAGRWPLEGSPLVLRAFDPPATPYAAGHRGVDLSGARGSPVLAAADGEVTFAGLVAGRGVVTVDHGEVRTTYEPVIAQVVAGQRVGFGDALGMLGAGGHCRSSCLHWGLQAGQDYLDPLLLVRSGTSIALVAGDRARAAEQAAAARARAAAAAVAGLGSGTGPGAAGWVTGPGGRHGFTRPVAGPVSSAFGLRLHPVRRVWKLHDGTDFAAPCGSPIRAPYAGRVVALGSHRAYGNRLLLEHGHVDGRTVRTSYNHAQRYLVAPGERVTQGQVLGYVGTTGWSTGCHLHLMVWLEGSLTNPMTWFT